MRSTTCAAIKNDIRKTCTDEDEFLKPLQYKRRACVLKLTKCMLMKTTEETFFTLAARVTITWPSL